MINVKVATRLREIYEIPPGPFKISDASTVGDVVEQLDSAYPGIKGDLLLDTHTVRPDVVFYLDDEPVDSKSVDQSTDDVSTVRIIQAMAGG